MPRRLHLRDRGRSSVVAITGREVVFAGTPDPLVVGRRPDAQFVVDDGTRSFTGTAAIYGDVVWVFIDGTTFEIHVGSSAGAGVDADAGTLSPPMPATVVRVAVTAGQAVTRGDLLVALEAMKMELPIRAARDGVVRAVHCREGELVQPGTRLLEIE